MAFTKATSVIVQGERRLSQLVFIGKELDEAKIRRGFAGCIAE